MALLDEPSRVEVWRDIMRDAAVGTFGSLTKAELRAAVDAVDAWADANAAAYNSAIPQPARGVLTAKQKALLLMYVAAKRHNIL